MRKQKESLPIVAYELKSQLKSLSETIKTQKKRIMGWQKILAKTTTSFGHDAIKRNLRNCSLEIKQSRLLYRHMHIAYSEILGNSRSRIEPKIKYAKQLSEELIQNFKK